MSSDKAEDLLSAASSEAWRTAFYYLNASLVGYLTWEILQLPLYTIWHAGSLWEQAFAAIHCTVGDLLIAAFTLALAWLTLGYPGWPASNFKRVAAGATALGVAYTIFSEWINTSVHHNWAYSDLMPVIPLFGFELGLAPVLQWSLVPPICFCICRLATQKVPRPHGL
jgi:hypothetical protein